MRATFEEMKLVKVEVRKFNGRDNKEVAYIAAKLIDDEGNVFEGPAEKSVLEKFEGKGKLDGSADIEVFTAQKQVGNGSMTIMKVRLHDFKPYKS